MRLRYDKNAESKLEMSNYLIKQGDSKILLDDKTILEIGMGKGEMIVELAKAYPELNFIGLEKYPTVAAKCIKKANEYKLSNFKILIDDAFKVDEIFEGQCKVIWLTFSDPWPKARHQKRRLTHPLFLEKYKKILDKDGILKFKSDSDGLYEFSLLSLQNSHWRIIDHGIDLHNSKHNEENYQTGYERKWSAKGKKINYIFAQKDE
ncbi:tRNA (guanosine(46)-N7)-methyltransferase TrmB [Mycoplasmopsis agalactiae]|uniref:tRNA (guanine-N(7)-)-methyltransferase n=1 Tax=Mycoplasmopsis agalactiae TaxID=2110 RepID=D3VRM8_MYCAA|nr:tRNA (guanosine(46)-N7)-methyltransferase TrmB [Mycoplasmopsis agalactiae]KAB6718366.1 tRNA (guanosine(46)-N7)-methyltransferase TrmB [Mycoplasmopsis agalactiae]CBH40976.1 tRNA (guanine N(7)) methyltransferase [Mycoplasmopsis agalactiae]